MTSAVKFTATKFSTIADKKKFEEQFHKFVESDFSKAKFPEWFYQRLSNTFGHIANFNRDGFYGRFFTSLEGKIQFIEQSLAWNKCRLGDPAFTYVDVEGVIINWIKDAKILDSLLEERRIKIEDAERLELARLKSKYEEKW